MSLLTLDVIGARRTGEAFGECCGEVVALCWAGLARRALGLVGVGDRGGGGGTRGSEWTVRGCEICGSSFVGDCLGVYAPALPRDAI